MAVIPLRPRMGQGTDPPAVRSRATVSLSDAESMRLRAALRHLRGLFGTWACLADAMGVKKKGLVSFVSGRHRGSPGMALAAARASGTPMERLLAPPGDASICPACGQKRRAP